MKALAWHGITAQARHLEQGSRRVRDILLAEASAATAAAMPDRATLRG